MGTRGEKEAEQVVFRQKYALKVEKDSGVSHATG